MTNDTQSNNAFAKELKQPIPFGLRLKTAREDMGIETKEAAAQLRLNEKIIQMLEKDRFPPDLPVTFIRGYMRSYGKLLQIPDGEIKKAVDIVKQKPNSTNPLNSFKQVPVAPVTSGNYFMQFFTYLILFTLLGLVSMWWYTHNTTNTGNSDKVIAELNEATAAASQIARPATLPVNNLATVDTANPAAENASAPAPLKPSNVEKLTNNTNPGIMPAIPTSNTDTASIEEELQATADEIEASTNDD